MPENDLRSFLKKLHLKAKVQKLVDLRYKCSKITMIALFRQSVT
jgi:ribosomal protein L44E